MGIECLESAEPVSVDRGGKHLLRLRFEKTGDFAFLSHHDLLRCLARLCRRANLPVRYAGEFRPVPRIFCPIPLPLGLEGISEVLEIELTEALNPEVCLDSLNRLSPAGLSFKTASLLPEFVQGRATTLTYAGQIPPDLVQTVRDRVSTLKDQRVWLVKRRDKGTQREAMSLWEQMAEDGSGNNLEEWVEKGTNPNSRTRKPGKPQAKGRPRMVDLKPMINRIDVANSGELIIEANTSDTGTARPDELVELLGLENEAEAVFLKRVRVDLADESKIIATRGEARIGANKQ